ncbi:hypothetical protein GTP38_23105 [Duganella sp. FT94W]|uniref:DUF7024 domain-containing protein n=1 Tax=Duganella lactea TaxID=2692173 RepID=A0ABW9VCL9_9BURK|nr:hypothetical protein [Duganella lactea]MYM37220.1 hypothetical protein [Duganella lactea]
MPPLPAPLTRLRLRLRPPPFAAIFIAALFAAFVYLTLRNMGLYPTIFGDEWTYSNFARLTPYREALIPSYLYYTVYGGTSACGDAFLECSRGVNALFYLGAAPWIYLLARRWCGQWTAAAVALLAVLRPSNTYTAYFMPEAMYFWGFWLFSWCVLALHGLPRRAGLVLSAAVLGMLALIKVHALFLLPAWCAFLLYQAWRARGTARPWLLAGLGDVALALLVSAAVRYGLGYLYAGRGGLLLLGQMYAGQAQQRPALAQLIAPALLNLRGHLLALLLLLPLPLAAWLLPAASARQRAALPRDSAALAVYTLLMMAALLATTVLFTALVAGGGNGIENMTRLHMRYYDFALPLLLLCAAAQLAPGAQQADGRTRLLVALPLAALLAYGYAILPDAYRPSRIDSPELFGANASPEQFKMLTLLALGVLGAWVLHARRGVQLFLFGYAPLLALLGGAALTTALREAQRPDDYVKAGVYARQYLRPDELQQLTVYGGDMAMLFKTRFMLDNPQVQLVQLAPGQTIDTGRFSEDSWGLVVGAFALPQRLERHSGARGFSLVRLPPAGIVIRFRESALPPGVRGIDGMSTPEDWGRWSDGDRVTLRFAAPLPAALTLKLDAAAFGPNASDDITVTVGDTRRLVRFGAARAPLALRFDTDGGATAITFDIPHPVSPHALGLGPDQRQIGLALYRLQVEPVDDNPD